MKNRKALLFAVLFLFLFAIASAYSDDGVRVEVFSPQGTVKNIRQVSVRFSEQMVAFGDPRLVEPFEIKCSEKGQGRWADGKNWVYDFDKDLPAGILCEFNIKPDMKSLSGKAFTGQKQFNFSTGGPSIRHSEPYEGNNQIDENQIFILSLDAEAKEESVLSNVWCSIEGINERVGVKIFKGKEKEKILKTRRISRYNNLKEMPVVVLQCKQSFPNDKAVSLIWGKGVESMSGVKTTEDHTLNFKSRGAFIAKFSCERENKNAACIPLLPMYLNFSSSVEWKLAKHIVLKGINKIYKPIQSSHNEYGEEEGEYAGSENTLQDETYVYGISFKGPFPENSSFVIDIPKDFKDDAGRKLLNVDKFPLAVSTASYPPLAKFSARFGIIELKGDPALPVTLRNIEPEVSTKMLKLGTKEESPDSNVKTEESGSSKILGFIKEKTQKIIEGLTGKIHKLNREEEETEIIKWLNKVESAKSDVSVIKDASNTKKFSVPKPGGAKAFEVIGIPLKETGFYVVEMESQILGSSLLEEEKTIFGTVLQKRPMYVSTAALVTNLSVHFKWGRESSLVWVTTLDKADPVKNASVSIRDCSGKLIWNGNTDENGISHIKTQIKELSYCKDVHPYSTGLFAFARKDDDLAFVHSSWDNGIEPWRFNLPHESSYGPVIAHTIFDRSLFRAGETVSMKHIIRKHTIPGFLLIKDSELPKSVLIRHHGSNQRYQFPLVWDANGIAETVWKIPNDVKLGTYGITLLKDAVKKPKPRTAIGGYEQGDEDYYYPKGWHSGSFRVEEFRVPLMKGIIQVPIEPLVNAASADVDLLVNYLSGGGASNASVKLRSQVQPKYVHFSDYDDFTFSNGEIKEQIAKRSYSEDTGMDQEEGAQAKVAASELTLDKNGNIRTTIKDLPKISTPHEILAELEFSDPNGEIQTVSQRIPLWNSKIHLGIKPDSWALSKDTFKFHVVALDLSGKPVSDKEIKVELFQRKYYSHRKRLIGGFYSYEHVSETKKIGKLCDGKTDKKGLLICEAKSPVFGNAIIQAQTTDDSGNVSVSHRDVWIAGKDEWWFDVSDSDRIDLLAEKKKYEPGEKAKFQVRMPFKNATVLISVEREGIMDTYVKNISSKSPVIEVPIKDNYAPNVFVSALVVRGRVAEPKPTAIIDLGKPSYKLGISEINVGWKAHELKVTVIPEKTIYKVRDKATVKIKVKQSNGSLPPKGSEIAVAVVDEGLLELMPNSSWKLLEAMMGRRGIEVRTSTAQMHVVGKRHYGLKALPQGGGGGKDKAATRQLFDTLLFWKGRVLLDEKGEANIQIPLNDSLTSFRIVAIANGSSGLFGSGYSTIKTTQDLMLFSGIPPVVREGDKFKAGFTVKNSTNRKIEVELKANVGMPDKKQLKTLAESLNPGESKQVSWDITVPYAVETIAYEVVASEKNGKAQDSIKVKQKVKEAVSTRVFQATLTQVENAYNFDVEKPEDAVKGKGGINFLFREKLSNGLGGVIWYMNRYPYTCMEQKVSRAIALRDENLWKNVVSQLPSHLDSDGLVKYFPTCLTGSDVLTSYILSISHEAGWEIPSYIKDQMEKGLKDFIEGKVVRYSSLQTMDLSIRKLSAVEALSRSGKANAKLLSSISIEPNLWPTSAVIDWMNILMRMNDITERDKKLKETEQIIRSRLNFQGTTMGFSTEGTDYLWWLMVSADVNAVKTVLTFLNSDKWDEDMPRLVRGALGRQYKGYWLLTTANAWGVLTMEKFSKKFESIPVTGTTLAALKTETKKVDWSKPDGSKNIMLGWPKEKETIKVEHKGLGKPWLTVQSLAAIPLKEPFSSGYKIKKTLTPVEQKEKGIWSSGDVVRVKLELEAQSDMTWVVVSDPIPGGATILGSGLGRDSKLLTKGEKKKGWVWPEFEERTFDAFRVYYEFVPKGKWTVEYTMRLNNEGTFYMPETRVEALYSPEMIGEMPNEKMEIKK